MLKDIQRKSFIGILANNGSLPVSIIRSTQENRQCYFVVLFKNQANMNKINRDSKQKDKNINLSEYGIVIAKGYGKNPTEKDKENIKKMYGIDIDKLFS